MKEQKNNRITPVFQKLLEKKKKTTVSLAFLFFRVKNSKVNYNKNKSKVEAQGQCAFFRFYGIHSSSHGHRKNPFYPSYKEVQFLTYTE